MNKHRKGHGWRGGGWAFTAKHEQARGGRREAGQGGKVGRGWRTRWVTVGRAVGRCPSLRWWGSVLRQSEVLAPAESSCPACICGWQLDGESWDGGGERWRFGPARVEDVVHRSAPRSYYLTAGWVLPSLSASSLFLCRNVFFKRVI